MSVYTKITDDELNTHLEYYTIGNVISFSGISEGIENTNYLLKTSSGDFIFTIFENITSDRVNDYLLFMNHLNNKGLISPLVIKTNDKELYKNIKNKPSAIIEKLEGKSIIESKENYCEQLGKVMADFHSYGSDFNIKINNSRGLQWAKESLEKLKNSIDENQLKILNESIEIQEKFVNNSLPSGMIHADLFRDNVLFSENNITGVIDFYYSCYEPYIYDLAVVANDWCNNKNNEVDQDKLKILLREYNKTRFITNEEKSQWKSALITAALRFYLSRLIDLHYPKIGEITHIKDPSIFEQILIDRLNNDYQIII